MPEDLYSKWLGLPAGERRPPDLYALLGLPRGCSDRRQIDEAASRQLGKLDAYAIHPDKDKREFCHRMMNEVAAARVLLIDDKRRQEYDKQIPPAASGAAAQMEMTLVMPALPRDAEPPADGHRLLHDMAAGGDSAAEQPPEAPVDEDDPVARAMAEVQGKPVLEENMLQSRVGPAPNVPWLLIGGGVMFLVAGAVAMGLMMTSRSKPAPVVSAPAPVVAPVAPPTRGGAVFFDNFERTEPGLEYRVVTGPSDALGIEQGKLTFNSPIVGTVRANLVPQNRKPFEEVSARISIEPGCRVIFGIINAARMTLIREGNQISITVTPGFPGTDPNKKQDWPRIDIPADGSVPVRLFRRREQISWAIGDDLVATSPEMRNLGDPGITIETSGPVGKHAAIDDLRIWFTK